MQELVTLTADLTIHSDLQELARAADLTIPSDLQELLARNADLAIRRICKSC